MQDAFNPATPLAHPAAPRASAAADPYGSPEQEAAFFYGLFLRGFSYQELRQDIAVPATVESQWQRHARHDPHFAQLADQMLAYRRRVLAIFQALVACEPHPVQ